jgi:hypothetical protein
LNTYDDIIVSHGDCIGADTEFHNLCVEYRELNPEKKLLIHIYPPNIRTMRAFNQADLLMSEEPYLKRNLNIIKNSSVLIACPTDKHTEVLRSGTWSTIRQAKKHGLQIYIL